MDYYYIGQWNWNTKDPNHLFWEPPQSKYSTGCIDLRSIPQMSISGGTPQGYSLFSYSQSVIDQNLTYLGNDLDAIVSPQTSLTIKNTLSIIPASTTLRSMIREILTLHSDPTGQANWKPLFPDSDLNMNINLGSSGQISTFKLIPNVSPEWTNVLATIQNDYAAYEKNLSTPTLQKILGAWQIQFGVPYTTFIPNGLPDIGSELPTTTIGDTFVDTNGTDLASHTATGTGGGFSWTNISPGSTSIIIESNAAQNNIADNGFVNYLANSPLSTSNVDVSGTLEVFSTNNNYPGFMARKDSSATLTYYSWRLLSGGADFNMTKYVSGTETKIGSSNSGQSANVPYLFEFNLNGSSLSGYISSGLVETVTDTTISTGTYVGIGGFCAASNQAQWSSITAYDISTSTVVHNMMLMGVGS